MTSAQEQQQLIEDINNLMRPLEGFLSAPDISSSSGPKKVYTGGRSPPSYQLPLDRALRLHALGNSWKSLAAAMGVSRQTLYTYIRDKYALFVEVAMKRAQIHI
ncbi:hypothetical protein K439DRAFT_1660717 [Ramaria rubella]|nr:hypothetical protein K439DRAFT_1660717 [Ramaria rubella]